MSQKGMQKIRTLVDEYKFPGFRPRATLKGIFGDPYARVITLVRRQKKHVVERVEQSIVATTTKKYDAYEISTAERFASTLMSNYAECIAGAVVK